MNKRLALLTLFAVVAAMKMVHADEWPAATVKDYFSTSGKFVAHVTPARLNEQSLLEVFEMKVTERAAVWQCKLGNKVAPVEVYVSNDGRYVVTNNEWHRVGYGDLVVAFYGKDGPIKNYSMEEVLRLPSDISNSELRRLVPHSVSSRWWDENSIKFFDTYNGKLHFCIWLHLFDRWIAWNPADGEEVRIDDEMVEKWNSTARSWAIQQIQEKSSGDSPYEFLGKLRYPDDRSLVEKLLSDEHFSLSGPTSQGNHLIRYTAASAKRLLAERLLAKWDGRPVQEHASSRQPLRYLGKLEGIVTLPKTTDPNNATLWIYVIPSTTSEGRWHKQPLVQRLVVSFADYGLKRFSLEYVRKFPLGISTVTPGQYRMKAVLDKTEPLSKFTDRICLPRQGDYQSHESPIICVKAGEIVDDITIDCTQKVIDGPD
jgi:hypothetical protein